MVLVVIILQFLTIFLILGSKKAGRGSLPRPGRPGAPGGEARPGKDADPRGNNKKPGDNKGGKPPMQQGGRPQQQQQPQPAAIAPAAKSLRDINLSLKNAEREQENARKRRDGVIGGIGAEPGPGPRDGRPPQQPPPHQQRGGNGGGRDGRSGDRPGPGPDRSPRREFNRDQPRRDNRPERQDRPPRGDHEDRFAGNDPQFEDRPPRFHEQPAAMHAPQAPDFAPNDFGVSEDQLQHGRKHTAKRRPLPENAGGDDAPENSAPAMSHAPANEGMHNNAQAGGGGHDDGGDMQFGRSRSRNS